MFLYDNSLEEKKDLYSNNYFNRSVFMSKEENRITYYSNDKRHNYTRLKALLLRQKAEGKRETSDVSGWFREQVNKFLDKYDN